MRYFAVISDMKLEFLIACRMAQGADGRGVMVRIAALSVAIGIAVMILALAVIMGFKREITRRVVGFAAHAEVTDIRGSENLASEPILRTEALEREIHAVEGVEKMWPYAAKGGVVRTPDAVQAMLLKGVDTTYDWSFFSSMLTTGTLPRIDNPARTKDLLISRTAADRLMLGVDDKVEMLFIDDAQNLRRDRFRICGIYSSGMEEMDAVVMLTDLRNVQRLAGWDNHQITGYEINTSGLDASDALALRIAQGLLHSELPETQTLIVSSVRERYPQIFDWLGAHNVNAAVIITIMLIVALFNMATALLILVLERTRMIGLLKAMGMPNGAVQRIFLWRAASITLRGMLWGNIAGIGLCLLQQQFRIVKLNSEGYLLSEVPIALGWGWWIALNIGVAAIIIALLALPARAVSSVKPAEAIRYES